jgi:hypothetical protein
MGDPPVTDDQIARDVWELGADGAVLAAPIETDGPPCEGALYARAASAGTPRIFGPVSPDDPERERALAAFRSLPMHRAIQRDYATYDGVDRRAPWDTYASAAPETVLFIDRAGRRVMVSVFARVRSDCASFNATAWALWEEVEGTLTPRTDVAHATAYQPRAIVDLDGDGQVEIVIEDGLLRASAEGGFSRVLDVTPPYLDCDC